MPPTPVGCTKDYIYVYLPLPPAPPWYQLTPDPYVTISNIQYYLNYATFDVTVAADAPGGSTEADQINIRCAGLGCGTWTEYLGSVYVDIPTPAPPNVTLQRLDLMDVQATGTPAGGTFSLSTQTDPASTTSTYATIDFASGSTSSSNPTTIELTEPVNPSTNGSPSPGGLEDITVSYATAGGTANDDFEVPTFGMSCYYTTLQSDWGTAPKNCQSLTIKGIKYAGTVTNPAGLPKGTYCSLFIAEVKLQGSGVLNSGQDIQYSTASKSFVQVSAINSADGTPVVANQTVARDRSIISPKGVLIDLDQVGTGFLANDTGGDITGYRIDIYKGAGSAVCANYNNIMAVGACNPATSGCPASSVQ